MFLLGFFFFFFQAEDGIRDTSVTGVQTCALPICTPDLNFCIEALGEYWIELKSLEDWPKRASTLVKIKHYSKEQKNWLVDRMKAGGNVGLLIRVDKDYLLFTHPIPIFQIGMYTKEMLFNEATKIWWNRVDCNEFVDALENVLYGSTK